MKKQEPNKLFVVRQYIWAKNAPHALKLAKEHKADECWVDEDFRKNMSNLRDAIGFKSEKKYEETD